MQGANDANMQTASPRAALPPLAINELSSYSMGSLQEKPESAASSPQSSALSPPQSALSPTQSDAASPSSNILENRDNPVIRKAISCSSLTSDVKQRRKRSRVTPEQLAKLEEFFASDNSPTSARRRDIARLLAMDERQTQIWFQNRRAKAKLQLKLKARSVEKLEPPPESPPELSSGFDVDIHGLIHEDDDVTVFPCTDLTIGSWRRMTSPQHDLIAYTCNTKRCLVWYIRSAGRGFKMEISFDHVAEARFTNVSPGIGSATFVLDRPPGFYMESPVNPALDEHLRVWQVSGDWTEAMQGSTHLRHCLVGPAYQLSALVNNIAPSSMTSEIPLYTPTPSISDAGSSPEVYTRSLHSPVEQMYHGSSLVLRRPSSLSSLRMLHHPSLERLRSRHVSVPLFHSPLSSTSTPTSPYAPSDGSMSMSPTILYLDGPEGQQYHDPSRQSATATPDQLTRLPLAMPNLPRMNYDGPPTSRSVSPYDCNTDTPSSAMSGQGFFEVSPTHPPNPQWGGNHGPMGPPGAPAGAYVPHNPTVDERSQEPYFQYPNGLTGPAPPAFAYEGPAGSY